MSDKFDPYSQWLGIPPGEQPANYYRLLGLEPFEDDLDAIESAADRLMQHVRDAATTEQRQSASEVLDELSTAKYCLLIVEQKRAYDAGLRAKRALTRDAKPAGRAPKNEQPAAVQVAPLVSKTRTTGSGPRKSKSKRSPPRTLAIAGVGILIGAAVLSFVFLRGDANATKQVAETSKALKNASVAPSAPAKAVASSETRGPKPEATVSTPPAPETDSSLPEFIPQMPEAAPPSDIAEPNAAPIDNESPPVVVSDSVIETSAEPSEVKEVAPPIEPTANRELAQSAERGGLLREIWTNVTGNKVEEFVQYVADNPQPNQTETIDRFEPPEDFGDQYGQRLRGYLHPPATGSYEFSIRANAEAWLYVSTDATPENKRRVEPGTKIELEADKAYYVEAFHKESSGRDYVSIGWKLPDATEENPIPGERLSVHHRIAPQHETEFVVLTPLSAESSSGTKLDMIDEGVIVAAGSASDNETYRLTFESEIETITALRLEAIPHESLPASGPGRGTGGKFTLADLSVTVASRETPDTSNLLNFASVVDDTGHDLRRIADGDEKTVWRVSGRGEPAGVTLVVRDAASSTGGATIQVEMKQREALGRFRLFATSAPDPRVALRSPGTKGDDETLYSLFVNLGGDDFTTPDGVRWRASKFFDNETFGHEGGKGVSEDLIANKVQGTAQRGISAFRAVVPDGTYEVTLYFCEYWSTTPTSRRFAIAAEQRVVAANFDFYQAAGGIAKPFVFPIRNVTVTDGRLDIDFRETSDGSSTILNAISIKQLR